MKKEGQLVIFQRCPPLVFIPLFRFFLQQAEAPPTRGGVCARSLNLGGACDCSDQWSIKEVILTGFRGWVTEERTASTWGSPLGFFSLLLLLSLLLLPLLLFSSVFQSLPLDPSHVVRKPRSHMRVLQTTAPVGSSGNSQGQPAVLLVSPSG